MHALKKVWNRLAASLAYSVKDGKGIEIKSVKEKEIRDRNWEAFFVILRGLRYAPRF